jgi:hypothetical protein
VGHHEGAERDAHIKVKIQSNSKLQSLILSPTQDSRPPCLQIDVQDDTTSDLGDVHMYGNLRS